MKARVCRLCDCDEADCSQCIARTGKPCGWSLNKHDVCTACAAVTANREGWEVVNIGTHEVTEHTTTHIKYVGTLRVSYHPNWGNKTFYITTSKADSLSGHSVALFKLDQGVLRHSPSRFANGKPRPINKKTFPTADEQSEALHLIKAMGWDVSLTTYQRTYLERCLAAGLGNPFLAPEPVVAR